MTSDHPHLFTPMMAKIYASQGYLEEAVRIYTYILKKSNHRQDLNETLQNLKEKISNLQTESDNVADSKSDRTATPPVFEEWVRILLRYSYILKLQNIRQHFNEKNQSDMESMDQDG